MNATQVCIVDDCTRGGVLRRGICRAHYQRMWRLGQLPVKPSMEQRLTVDLVRTPTGCHEWSGRTNDAGYGMVYFNGRNTGAHRVAWRLANGPIPEGLSVLHHCDNPPCCETEPSEAFPEGHLFLGTRADNNADKATKGRAARTNSLKTHCPENHAYDEANTYVYPDGRRGCRTCRLTARAA